MSYATVTTRAELDTSLERSALPVLIKVAGDWCPFCRKMLPIDEKLSADFAGKVTFVYWKVPNVSELRAGKYAINDEVVRTVPHYIYLKNGKEVLSRHGSVSEDELRKNLEKLSAK